MRYDSLWRATRLQNRQPASQELGLPVAQAAGHVHSRHLHFHRQHLQRPDSPLRETILEGLKILERRSCGEGGSQHRNCECFCIVLF